VNCPQCGSERINRVSEKPNLKGDGLPLTLPITAFKGFFCCDNCVSTADVGCWFVLFNSSLWFVYDYKKEVWKQVKPEKFVFR